MAISEVINGEGATAGTTAFNLCDATDTNIAFDLPPLEAVRGNGLMYIRVDATANTCTITPCEAAGVTIQGDASITIDNQYDQLEFIAPPSGDAWIVKATTSTPGGGAGDVTLNGVQTLTNKTLTSPKINTFQTTTGATRRTLAAEPVTPVNYFTDTISGTGDPVYQQAAGSDTNIDFGIAGKGTGAVLMGPSVSEGALTAWLRGGAGNLNRKVKKITSMTDATWIDLFTVTVPNAAHSAGLIIRAVGALGDADSTACDEYFVAIARQSGEATIVEGDINVTAVAQPSATGAQTILMEFQCSGMTGAVGATQTFTVQGKITRGGGASDNHYMTCLAELLNQNASGVTFT